MKKTKQKILLILLFLSLITISLSVLADTLTITTNALKKEINIGETTTVTVNWKENMQAADFILNYDNSKLKLKSTTVPEDNYANENGKIKVMWYSSTKTPEEKKEFTFVFEGIAQGDAQIEFQLEGGFATGSLSRPEEYDLKASKTIIKVIGANVPDDGNNDGAENGGTGNGGTGNGGTGNGGTGNGATGNGGTGNGGTGNGATGNGGTGNGATGNGGTGNGGTGNGGTGNGGTGNGGTGNGATGNGATGNGATGINGTENKTTNPTQIPTKLPKAGKIHMASIFVVLIGITSFIGYKLNKYKEI